MTMSLGFLFEGLVGLLLVATIGYCVIVSRKLDQLRDEQRGLRKFILDFSQATMRADHAIKGLRATVQDSEQGLADRISDAKRLLGEFDEKLENAERIMTRLTIASHGAAAQARGKSDVKERDEQIRALRELRKSRLGFGVRIGEGGNDADAGRSAREKLFRPEEAGARTVPKKTGSGTK